ncbi:MAG: Hpt domain-containing protein [Bosea sp.]|uniref:Hpt domain-containing protein n=1 Tax=Bosea sp. (in: a-proteobacteria) TaxID=1871050 RepID=UPI001AD54C86|nr:Hpt domain-containing protein [Bosea sp. (in: a-proteobacteria)]MBN9450662.1 Hpt domain-containing protein [Bosea sp. (in: a-proteobacteria)]
MTEKAIDLAYLSRQTAGDHDLERELLTLFAQQCVVHLRTIHGSADRQARIDAAHTLKGAARAIGAWQVAEAADCIEEGLSGPQQEANDSALDALALAAAEARAVIARFDCAA